MNEIDLEQRIEELEKEIVELKEQLERYAEWNKIFPRNYPYVEYVPYSPFWFTHPINHRVYDTTTYLTSTQV